MLNKVKLKEHIIEEIANKNHLDISLGYVSEKEETYFNYGVSKPEISENDYFEMASISKIFTSILVVLASLREMIHLDDYIDEYIDEFPIKKKITINDLLTHRAGLTREPQSFKFIAPENSYIAYDRETFLRDLSNLDFDKDLKGKFSYSNYGYIILGELVKKIFCESDFEKILLENVIRPLDLNETFFKLPEKYENQLKHGHYSDLNPVIPYFDLGDVYNSAGALISTTREMIKYCRIFMGEIETSDELRVAINQALKIEKDLAGNSMCSAFHISEFNSHIYYYHPGNIAGHKAALVFSPTLKKALVYNTTTLSHLKILWELI